MNIGGPEVPAELWAHLLVQECYRVLRVPELRPALRWWRAATGARVTLKGRLGDLQIAVLQLDSRHGEPVVVVGGPGALEVSLADTTYLTRGGTGRAIDDPWGNRLVIPVIRQAAGVAA